MTVSQKPQALMIVGPTASGKSALSLAMAARRRVEIISMDSALVYRGMDIGSAKPTREERAVCPHHLIDIREIGESYSAAEFLEDTVRLVRDIHARGAFPLIVGGTMLYAKALRDGIHDMPSTDPIVREAVSREGAEKGWPALHRELSLFDPQTALRLSPNDSQRIGRAIEVYRMTGKPLSAYHAEQKSVRAFPFSMIGLLPGDRKRLHTRIEKRFQQMLQNGFLDEVRGLMQREDFDAMSPAMRAVGYRQAVDYLQGKTDYDGFVLAGVAATRQLAKRQMTWMRGMDDMLLLDPEEIGTMERSLQIFDEMTDGSERR